MEFTRGDILHADTEAVVNTVNCVGFMGRGIAAQFKRVYPDNFAAYAAACKREEVIPGRMFVFATGRLTPPRYVINFPTKRHWRAKSRIEDIDSGLRALVEEIVTRGITSIAIPPLGCGLGGLAWSKVRPRIEEALRGVPGVRVVIYEPTDSPTVPQLPAVGTPPPLTPGRAVLVGLIERYLAGFMDPSVSLLEVHKLLYFAQEAGERLRLRFVKGPYGPYAENLRHVLAAVEGFMLTGYGAGGDSPEKPLELVAGVSDAAQRVLAEHPQTKERFNRVAALVQGFETPFGMELLATVHWVVAHDRVDRVDRVDQVDQVDQEAAIVTAVHAWSPRKRMFTARQILLTARRLAESGWIAPGPLH